MTSMTSTIGSTDYERANEIIACDWCDNLYEESRYCERCGPVLSNNQIADLMLFVEETKDIILDDLSIENVSSILNEMCPWYDGSDYAYQKMCFEYLERQPRTSKIDKALNFFDGCYEHCDGCEVSYHRYVGHKCKEGHAFDRNSIFVF